MTCWALPWHSHFGAHGQHDAGHKHLGLNPRSAYIHVLADAATSVLAILARPGRRVTPRWGRALRSVGQRVLPHRVTESNRRANPLIHHRTKQA